AHWRRIAGGQVQVVVGARSAVFAPTRRLGLIVIDEEHEGSFKQEATPRYHARDVAVMRARLAGVPILLRSATANLGHLPHPPARCACRSRPLRASPRPAALAGGMAPEHLLPRAANVSNVSGRMGTVVIGGDAGSGMNRPRHSRLELETQQGFPNRPLLAKCT